MLASGACSCYQLASSLESPLSDLPFLQLRLCGTQHRHLTRHLSPVYIRTTEQILRLPDHQGFDPVWLARDA